VLLATLFGKLGSAVPSFSWKRVPLMRWAPSLQRQGTGCWLLGTLIVKSSNCRLYCWTALLDVLAILSSVPMQTPSHLHTHQYDTLEVLQLPTLRK
jgi:hypothetical protein